jgi:fibronectin type 3 domain-containing protein
MMRRFLMTGKLNSLLIAAAFIATEIFIAACSLPIDPPALSVDKSLPPPPQVLTAKTVSETSIQLEWEGIPAAASYLVYRGGEEEGEYTHVAVSSIPSYTDAGLEREADYWYKVSAAKDNAGEGPLSAAVHASTKHLSPPETIITHVVSQNQIDIEWPVVPGAASYKVYRAASSATGPYKLLESTEEPSYTDNTVSVNNKYYYTVSSVGITGEGAKSEAYSAAIWKPDAPVGISAAAASPDSIVVSWEVVPGATGYKLYRSTSADGDYVPITAEEVTGTVYTDNGLSPDTDYFYKVSAVNGIGESGLSNYAKGSTRRPAAPVGVNVTGGPVAASLAVSWDGADGAASYKVYRSSAEDGVYTQAGASETTTYTDTGLVMGTVYYYRVSAVNAAGEGEKSASAHAAAPSIPVPADLTASVESASSIKLSWNAVAGATGYKLYFALTLEGDYSLAAEVTGTSYIHTGRTKGQQYFYKAASVSGGSESGMSAAVSTIIAVPAAPADLTVEPLSHASLKVSWAPVPGAKLYSVYRDTANSVSSSDIITSTTAAEYTDTGLNPFCQYYYKVSAVNDIGTGNLSAAAVSAYTQPVPLTNEEWRSNVFNGTSYSYYIYYSFPVTGGKYYIQWANGSQTGEASSDIDVSAYWNSKNSMTDVITTYFTNKKNGFNTPQVINAPSSGYIILKVNVYTYYTYSIRFYKEEN